MNDILQFSGDNPQLRAGSPIGSPDRSAVEFNSADGRVPAQSKVFAHFGIDERTIVFTPAELLRPQTVYHITIRPGLRDVRGHINRAETVLSFPTQ